MKVRKGVAGAGGAIEREEKPITGFLKKPRKREGLFKS